MANLDIKGFWQRLDANKKRGLILFGVIGAIFMFSFMSTSEDRGDRLKQRRPAEKVQTNIFGGEDKGFSKQDVAAQLRAMSQEMKQLLEENSSIKAKQRDIETAMIQSQELFDNPEEVISIKRQLEQLRQNQEGFEDWTKNRIALKGIEQVKKASSTVDGSKETILVDGKEYTLDELAQLQNNIQDDFKKGNVDVFSNQLDITNSAMNDLERELENTERKPSEAFDYGADKKKTTAKAKKAPSQQMYISDNNSQSEGQATQGAEQRRTGKSQREISRENRDGEKKKESLYIPSNSLVEVVILSGVDAPTSSAAKRNPHPILLKIEGEMILPNGYRVDLRNCHVSGETFGEASSERAFVRTNNMSCVLGENKIVDIGIKGYLSGSDGKVGLRGRMVSKRGSLIYNSLLAGIFSGTAEGLKPQRLQSIQTGDAAGAIGYAAPNANDVMGVSAANGLSNSAKNISEWYLEQADNIFPVIEIDALRSATLVISKGFELKPKESSGWNVLADIGS